MVSSVPPLTCLSENALMLPGAGPGDGAVVLKTNGSARRAAGTLAFGASVARYQPTGALVSRSRPGSCDPTSYVAVAASGSTMTRACRRCGCANVYAVAAYARPAVTTTATSRAAVTSDGRTMGFVAAAAAMNGGTTIVPQTSISAGYTHTGVMSGSRPKSATTNRSSSTLSRNQSVPETASTTTEIARTAGTCSTGTASSPIPATSSGSVQR